MRNLAAIDENKDLVTKEYVDGKNSPFPLDITDPDIDLSTTPSTARYDQTLRGLDANGDIIWAVDSVHDTSGAHGFQLNSFGGDNQNSLQMLMKPDGTASMWISQPAVWRNALGAAASSHNHAASNITSGVLATARGGVPTGGTTGQVLAKTSDSDNAVGWVTPSGSGGGVPTGTVSMFAGSTAPTGYLLCQGQAVSRTTYSALFSVIGTAYGAGDGSTTFNLPNLQGKFALGKSSSYALGSAGGASTVTLTTNQIPAHTHGNKSLTGWAKMWGDTGFIGRGGNADWGGIIKPGDHWYGTSPVEDSGWQSSALEIDASHEHDSVGGGAAHNNMPPYQTVNYIIKT